MWSNWAGFKDRQNHESENRLVCTHQPQFITRCEITWIKLEVAGSQPLYISAYYRPHEHDEDSLDELKRSLEMVRTKKGNIWLVGDLNFPKMTWKDYIPQISHDCQFRQIYDKFVSIIEDFSLTQMVLEPTRSGNTLDLFLTTNETLVNKVYTIPGVSDHDIVCVEANLKPKLVKVKPRRVFFFKKANWDLFRSKMEDFKNLYIANYMGKTIEDLWNEFKTNLDIYMNECIPSKVIKGKSSLPWITQDIRRTTRRRNKLYCRQKKTGKHTDRDKYLKHRHEARKKIKDSYQSYVENIIGINTENTRSSTRVNSKKLYSLLKHSRQDNQGISPLQTDGHLVTDTKDKANTLNRQFQSVFTPKSPLTLSQLCQMQTEHDSQTSDPGKSFGNTMPDFDISSDGIFKLLKGLNPNKAAGPDQIKPLILRELRWQIAPILQVIFTVSLETGQVPKDWTSANVAPLYKKGDKTIAANYRPISLTCIVCKIMEHIVASKLVKFLDANNILYDLQHGFRERRSTETQLVMLVEDLVRNASQGKQTDLILLDFSKAFDMVSHEKLLYKLHRYGVRGPTLAWIRAFLEGRTQTVVLEGESSDTIPVTSGVPQGSVLGPILFLVYINDLPECVTSQVRLFADDTAVYLTINDRHTDGLTLQNDLDKLQEWSQQWDMSFNPSKCQVIQATKARVTIPTTYTLHGQTLQTVSSARYLGVDISRNLSWNTHVNRVATTANNTLGFLKRNLKCKAPKVRETTYKTLVRPQLEYASSVWDPHTRTNIDKLEMVQRRAARWTLCDYSRYSSVSNMLQQLGWRSLEQRRADARLCLFYKIVNNMVAVPVPAYIQPITRLSRSCHPASYRQIHTGADYYKFSFYPLTIVQWNALPVDVVLSGGLNNFKSSVSTINHVRP